MKRIAVFGTHGSAKTTLVYKLAAYFKMQDKNVTVIHETARKSPFPINQGAVYQTTLFLIASQLKKELEAEAGGFEISISDRTLSDAFVYINYLKRDNQYTHVLEDFCMQWVKQYDLLVYLEPTPGYLPTDDGIRACDASYQNAIRDDFRHLIKQMQKVHGDTLPLIQSESNHVFDETESAFLLKQIYERLYSGDKIKALLEESKKMGSTV